MSSDRFPGTRDSLRTLQVLTALTIVGLSTSPALGGGWKARTYPSGTPVPTATLLIARPVGSVNNYGRLGSFYPTPYIMVRGNAPAGGGYSPLGIYGESTMALYGPFSPFRATSAPVRTYTRGYDGRTIVSQGTSFSSPNLPSLTPVVYPTQANNYYGFRQSNTPPWWANGSDWLDQN